MKVSFRQSFTRDLKRIKDKVVLDQIKQVIEQIEVAQQLNDIKNLAKVSGGADYYRVRIGNYRLGIAVLSDEVEIVRCLHRRDIYRYFP